MNTQITTVAPAVLTETIRPVDAILKDFTRDGDKLTMTKGAKVSASEFALLITDLETRGQGMRTQARYAYYEAGRLSGGEQIQAEIVKRLENMLSRSALAQLKSEATNLVPLAIAQGFKAPLSILKDAVKELGVDDKTGKLKPTKAGKELLPLLRAGTVTQAAVRDIRAKHKLPSTAAPRAKASDSLSESEKAIAGAIASLSSLNKSLETLRPEGDDMTALRNLLTDVGRKLGVVVTLPGAKPAPVAPPAKTDAK